MTRDMDNKSLTTLTTQYRKYLCSNASHQECLRAVAALRALSIIIAIRRTVVG